LTFIFFTAKYRVGDWWAQEICDDICGERGDTRMASKI
jgi:hypothetical protein